ncbi:hypothetical protein CP532_1487 [Ophiocordyceps camponoti-leonardi (nom. inval.)]|nr:hypothetical protein CP532_1487 [Ophiocordyceps camponoti-leonardi (nom. inval.)]
MEDPWGDPWSTDVPATTTIELSASAYTDKSATDGYSPRPVTDPWSTEADGWTSWGRSPDPDLRAGPSSPDPWAGVERKLFVEGKDDEGHLDDRGWEPDGADKEPTRRNITDRDTGRQSSKVAELVDMYDGMARHSSRSSSAKRPTARDDVAVSGTDDAPTHLPDVGGEEKPTEDAVACIPDDEDESASKNGGECEREDVFSEMETDHVADRSRDEPPVSMSSGEDCRDDGHLTAEMDDAVSRALEESMSRTLSGECQQIAEENHDATAKTSPTTSPDDSQQDRYPAKVAYSINLPGLLDSIFPTVPSPPSPEPTTMSPVDDTFSTVSERKAWYRIARPGSMRRHNLGDEEGYTRVGWAKSRTRERTLKIVRRWMEEDSSGGRNVLGRRLGSVRSTSFNWDSPASTTPVPIGELLRSRERGVEGPIVPGRAVAAFDWSSSGGGVHEAGAEAGRAVVVSRTAEASKVGIPLQPQQPLRGPHASQPGDHQIFSLKPHPSSVPVTLSRDMTSPVPAAADDNQDDDGDNDEEEAEEAEEDDDDEDDDDWGEMVSASATSAPPPASGRKAAWSGFGGDVGESSPVREEATSRLLQPCTPAARSAASRPLMSGGESPLSGGGGLTTTVEDEDDELVRRVLGAIPDLSYMLR